MRIAYFDCLNGASGDMIVGSLIDAGMPIEALREGLTRLQVPGFTIDAQKIKKQGLAATQFHVEVDPNTPKPHRHLKHVKAFIEGSTLSDWVRTSAIAIFTKLAESEAAVHGTTIEKVHFHEVGAIDAIVDVVGACIGFEYLGVQRIECSPIPTGSGTVTCEHGVMPVPAPATAMLLRGIPLAASPEVGELTTPTGAAILATMASSFGSLPSMTMSHIGMGSGTRDGQTRPNVLRVLIGEGKSVAADQDEHDEVAVLEVNLDDTPAEVVGYTLDRLLAAGALDVYTTPVQMKKNRPGVVLTVLAPLERQAELEEVLFKETPTLGVRSHRAMRRKLARTVETVQTMAGPIRIKIGWRDHKVAKASPEYEDCRVAAERTGRPLIAVMEDAMAAWQKRGG